MIPNERIEIRRELTDIVERIRAHMGTDNCKDKRAASIAITELQTGAMWFTGSFFTEESRMEFAIKE